MLPPLVLLPGLDGTGLLFQELEAAAPSECVVVGYPRDERLGYSELMPLVLRRLPAVGPYLLVGESFSGPLALRVASQRPPGLAGVVLVASFVRSPLPIPFAASRCLAGLLPCVGPLLFRHSPPRPALRLLLAGWDASPELLGRLTHVIGTVAPAVMAHRTAELLRVDARRWLAECEAPLLYLQASRDRLVLPSSAKLVASVRPDVTIADIDASHLVLQRAPEASLEAIRRWWSSRAPKPTEESR